MTSSIIVVYIHGAPFIINFGERGKTLKYHGINYRLDMMSLNSCPFINYRNLSIEIETKMISCHTYRARDVSHISNESHCLQKHIIMSFSEEKY